MPPNGFGCKCRVRQVGRAEHKRLVTARRVTTTRPKIKMKEWEFAGEIFQSPEGLHPAWAYNPGAAPWTGIAQTTENTASKLIAVGTKPAQSWVQDFIAGPGFENYITRLPAISRHTIGVPVAITGEKTPLILTPAAAKKGQRWAPDYHAVQAILSAPTATKKRGAISRLAGDYHGEKWELTIAAGNRPQLISLRRSAIKETKNPDNVWDISGRRAGSTRRNIATDRRATVTNYHEGTIATFNGLSATETEGFLNALKNKSAYTFDGEVFRVNYKSEKSNYFVSHTRVVRISDHWSDSNGVSGVGTTKTGRKKITP